MRATSSRGTERLGHVVVSTDLKRGDLVLLLTARGQHDDRDVAGALVGTQAAGELDARCARQHPVEQHEVGQRFAHDALRGFGVVRAHDVVTRAREVGGDQFLDCRFVFHEQYVRWHAWDSL